MHHKFFPKESKRTYLCGTDESDHAFFVLEYIIEHLVDDGDEIICVRVVERDAEVTSVSAIEKGQYRKEAEKVCKDVQDMLDKRGGPGVKGLIVLAAGKVGETLDAMVSYGACLDTNPGSKFL